jgi:hypothetical protein
MIAHCRERIAKSAWDRADQLLWRSSLPESLADLVLAVAGKAKVSLEELLQLPPDEQPRGVRLGLEPVEHHGHPEFKAAEGPGLREADDPTVGSTLPLECRVPHFEVADVVGDQYAPQVRCTLKNDVVSSATRTDDLQGRDRETPATQGIDQIEVGTLVKARGWRRH